MLTANPILFPNCKFALKECYETEYWLELFVKSEIINRENTIDLYNRCGTIRRILVASINTAKENLQKEKINSKSKPNLSV